MDAIGLLVLLAGAVAIGVVGQASRLLPRARAWRVGTVAAGFGGFAGSELLGPVSAWGPELGGLFVLPALLTGLAVAGLVDLLARLLTPGPLGWHATTPE